MVAALVPVHSTRYVPLVAVTPRENSLINNVITPTYTCPVNAVTDAILY